MQSQIRTLFLILVSTIAGAAFGAVESDPGAAAVRRLAGVIDD